MVETWSELLGVAQIGGGSGLGFDTKSKTVSVGEDTGSQEICQNPSRSVAATCICVMLCANNAR